MVAVGLKTRWKKKIGQQLSHNKADVPGMSLEAGCRFPPSGSRRVSRSVS